MISILKYLYACSCPFDIGDIYITTNSENPSSIFLYTSWDSFAIGKTLVGLDVNDTDFNEINKIGGVKGAWYHNHTQTAHSHAINTPIGTASGSYTRPRANTSGACIGSITTGGPSVYNNITYAGNNSNQQDKEKANLQPYITTYIWVRTG